MYNNTRRYLTKMPHSQF